jgi:hypothetical protein
VLRLDFKVESTRLELLNPDNPLGREGMASGLPHPRQGNIRDYWREAGAARRRKTVVSTHVGP